MSTTEIKEKIAGSLEKMNAKQLQAAWQILQEISYQEILEDIEVDKNIVNKNIAVGIRQLNNGEGTYLRTALKSTRRN